MTGNIFTLLLSGFQILLPTVYSIVLKQQFHVSLNLIAHLYTGVSSEMICIQYTLMAIDYNNIQHG